MKTPAGACHFSCFCLPPCVFLLSILIRNLIFSLYTLDGIEVLEPSQIKSMEKYVAVGFGKKFLKMPYNENGSTAITPRRNGAKVKSTTSEPPLRKVPHDSRSFQHV